MSKDELADRIKVLEQTNENLRITASSRLREITTFRERVRSVFKDLVDQGVMDLSDANDALTELGLQHLAAKYSATLEIVARVTFESSEDDNAIEAALKSLNIDIEALYGASTELDEFDVDSVTVESVDVGEY